MVVTLTMIVFAGWSVSVTSYILVVAAFVGSLLATGFILIISRKVHHMASLLVAGIMVGYICQAVTDFLINMAEDSDIVNLTGWSMGSFSGTTWSSLAIRFAGVMLVW